MLERRRDVAKGEDAEMTLHPGHGWGVLARNPWLEIVPDIEAGRQVLRRYWVRNGGVEVDFDRLFPPSRMECLNTNAISSLSTWSCLPNVAYGPVAERVGSATGG
jgi:hypothetical protein